MYFAAVGMVAAAVTVRGILSFALTFLPPLSVHKKYFIFEWTRGQEGEGEWPDAYTATVAALYPYSTGRMALCVGSAIKTALFFFFFSFFTVNGSQHLGGGLSLEVNSLMCAVSQKNIYSLEFSFNIGCVFSKWVN